MQSLLRTAIVGAFLAVPSTTSAACIEGPTGECLPVELQPIDLISERAIRARADLAVGISTNAQAGGTQTGAVAVFRGRRGNSVDPMPLVRDQLLMRPVADQSSLDLFGSASVLQDFDADDFEDLVIGIAGGRRDDLNERPGLAAYFKGGPDGFTYLELITKGLRQGGLPGAFGQAIASGDFNGDGLPDLAIGSPGDPNAAGITGAVFVYFNTGATEPGAARFVPPTGLELVPFGSLDLDNVGWTLAVGDLDLDGDDELIVGVPGRTVNDVPDAGELSIYRSQGDQAMVPYQRINLALFDQDITPSRFGQAIEVADFNADGRPDIAVGAPAVSTAPTGLAVTGKVYILQNTENGLVLDAVLDQTGMDDQNDEEGFGYALAAGDMDGDGLPELGVGAPFNMTPPRDTDLIAVGVPTTFIIANMRRWRGDAQVMRSREGLLPRDVLAECFDPQPIRQPQLRPVTDPIRNEPGTARRADALTAGRTSNRLLPRPGGPLPNRGFDCNLLIPEHNRQPIVDRDPKRTGRVFLFANDNGSLVADMMLGAGAPHPTQNDALIGVSLKSADFNGDGYADLVSGAMGKRPQSGSVRSGAAEVFIGGMDGLRFVGELDQTGLSPEVNLDRFGGSLDR